MVSDRLLGKNFRFLVPLFGLFGLGAIFFKLPEIQKIFGCKACLTGEPFIPLIATLYFGFLTALSLLFPAFPNRYMARGGLLWALLLGASFTYINLPEWCLACLVGHASNILIWSVWLFFPSKEPALNTHRGLRGSILFFAPLSLVALFSSLNLTFMAYGFKPAISVTKHGLYTGNQIPTFSTETILGDLAQSIGGEAMVLNFISADCPFCKEQLQVLGAVNAQLKNSSYRFINVSPTVPFELTQLLPEAEWIEDKDDALKKLFKVHGYPTMYVVDKDGKISRVMYGVYDNLISELQSSLSKS